MTSRSFEREVRNVIVGGLVTLLFLAGTAAVVLRNTTAWGVAENERRLVRETRSAAGTLAAGGSPVRSLGDDAGAGRALREGGARSAALYDARGARLIDAPYLPGAGESPVRLSAEDLAATEPLVRDAGEGPVVLAPLPGDGRVLRVAWNDPDVAAVRRNARIVLVAVPAAAAVLVVLVVPFLRRLMAPIDAIAETARGAGDLVPEAVPRAARDEAEGAAQTFARTLDALRNRTVELEQLRRSEQLRADALAVTAETLVRSHPGGLLVVDAAGRLAEANGPARAVLGLGDADVGRPAAEVLADVPVLASAAERARAGAPTLSTEFALGDDTGGRFLEVIAVPILDAGQDVLGALLFVEDRTETRRLEREVSSRRELAALGEMSAGIAHEFRNATGTILGWARLAARTDDAAARARHLEAIQAEAEHVARVTGDFLFFAKPERLETAPCDLGALAREIAAEQKVITPAVDVSVAGTFAPAQADAALVKRALVNLVKNACEAALDRPGGGRVVLSGDAAAGTVRVAVEDDGPGVPDESAAKLFVPFYSTKEAGTGLGLALVAKIAALHRGGISVERSAALGGARFVLSLPAAR
ncbi:MAG: PAS domain-containing protein [Acidobacteria bacterium]|nr:PAS domain-containing protein [Acidobacteriota bacterium]